MLKGVKIWYVKIYFYLDNPVYGTNWEYAVQSSYSGSKLASLFPPERTQFLLIADNVDNSGSFHILGINNDEHFKNTFEYNFRIRYNDWMNITGEDLFSRGMHWTNIYLLKHINTFIIFIYFIDII